MFIKQFICKIFFFVIQLLQGCVNQKNESGYCINIKRCTFLKTLLQNHRRNATAIKFVRESACGFDGRDPKVCCPIRTIVSNNNNKNGTVLNNKNVHIISLNNSGKYATVSSESFSSKETISSSKLPVQNLCGRKSVNFYHKVLTDQPVSLGK